MDTDSRAAELQGTDKQNGWIGEDRKATIENTIYILEKLIPTIKWSQDQPFAKIF